MGIKENDQRYLAHTYARFDVVLTHGKGCRVYDENEKEYLDLTEELRFFESAVKSVSGMPGTVLSDLVFGQMTWDKVAEKHYISRRTVGNYRAKAIVELEKMYQRHDDEVVAYMLS